MDLRAMPLHPDSYRSFVACTRNSWKCSFPFENGTEPTQRSTWFMTAHNNWHFFPVFSVFVLLMPSSRKIRVWRRHSIRFVRIFPFESNKLAFTLAGRVLTVPCDASQYNRGRIVLVFLRLLSFDRTIDDGPWQAHTRHASEHTSAHHTPHTDDALSMWYLFALEQYLNDFHVECGRRTHNQNTEFICVNWVARKPQQKTSSTDKKKTEKDPYGAFVCERFLKMFCLHDEFVMRSPPLLFDYSDNKFLEHNPACKFERSIMI